MTTAAAALLLLAAAARRGDLLAALDDGGPVDLGADGAEQGQGGTALEVAAMLSSLDISPYMQPDTTSQAAAQNLRAFLLTIRRAEGTMGPDGYRTLFGGTLFTSYADHPRRAVWVDRLQRWTTAAGAYQFMAISPLPTGGRTRVDTWDRLQARLNLPDFTPASQDRAAVQLIDDAGALADVEAGRFADAVSKVRRIWASLPGAGYGQPEVSFAALQSAYLQAGGKLA